MENKQINVISNFQMDWTLNQYEIVLNISMMLNVQNNTWIFIHRSILWNDEIALIFE